MSAYRRVDANQAGPTSLGILVPPGASTLVIVRPRTLAWDLLPAQWTGESAQSPRFCQFGRDDAAGVARRFSHHLEDAARAGINLIETFGDPDRSCYQIWVRTSEFVWIVCERTPGQAYRPVVFASREAVDQAAASLASYFAPADEANQEYYFNTQHFR